MPKRVRRSNILRMRGFLLLCGVRGDDIYRLAANSSGRFEVASHRNSSFSRFPDAPRDDRDLDADEYSRCFDLAARKICP